MKYAEYFHSNIKRMSYSLEAIKHKENELKSQWKAGKYLKYLINNICILHAEINNTNVDKPFLDSYIYI